MKKKYLSHGKHSYPPMPTVSNAMQHAAMHHKGLEKLRERHRQHMATGKMPAYDKDKDGY